MRALVSPEQCCAYYSMLAAEQRLKVSSERLLDGQLSSQRADLVCTFSLHATCLNNTFVAQIGLIYHNSCGVHGLSMLHANAVYVIVYFFIF